MTEIRGQTSAVRKGEIRIANSRLRTVIPQSTLNMARSKNSAVRSLLLALSSICCFVLKPTSDLRPKPLLREIVWASVPKPMSDLRLLISGSCALLFALSLPLQAQQPKKVSRIGYLSNSDPITESARAKAIRLALRERGYMEGLNIATEYRYAEGKPDRYAELAAELVRLKLDIMVVPGGVAPIRAAKNATKTIPIIMVGQGLDPVEAGLIENLARPGGNVTGITNLGRELGGKRLELFKEAVPKVSRVAVLYDPALPRSLLEAKQVLPVAANPLKLTLQPWEVRTADAFDRVF